MPSRRESKRSVSRRRFLAAGSTTATVAVAGCAGIVDWIAGFVLEDVNVFNETDRQVEGTIELRDAGGTVVLDESFTLDPPDNDDDDNNSNLATYADIWTDANEYEVSVELATPVEGESSASETFTIEDSDEERLFVVLGSEELDDSVAFRVGEELSDANVNSG